MRMIWIQQLTLISTTLDPQLNLAYLGTPSVSLFRGRGLQPLHEHHSFMFLMSEGGFPRESQEGLLTVLNTERSQIPYGIVVLSVL